uniref:Putative secreted protein n=1 Tax=Ixodes ricinus TaxID=34613 RepID=A0A6B0TRE6_IXORI
MMMMAFLFLFVGLGFTDISSTGPIPTSAHTDTAEYDNFFAIFVALAVQMALLHWWAVVGCHESLELFHC